MPKGHKPAPQPSRTNSPQPAECRDALQWFIDTVGLYATSSRGLIATDFSEDQEPLLESAIINLKSRGINAVVVTGEALYRQGEFLWEQAVQHTRFGRPLASQFELEMTGADVLILRNIEAPETAHHLWYLYHQVFYPRALAGKPLLMTSPLSLDELHKYGSACDDFEFAGRKLTWEKLAWLMEATCIDGQHYRTLKEEGLPPMLKAEHVLLNALKERGLVALPQHVLGDYMLDIAMIDRDRKLDIECDVLTSLDSTGANAWQAKKNLLLLSDGWKVLKFTTAEIVSNIHACVDVVEEVWTQGRKRSSIGRLLSGQAAASVPELPVDDDVQRLVITHGAGPCAVEGGAGTGKSSCVIHRVAYLLAQGVNPDRILVLSHSQDTVKALKASVEAISDRQAVQRVSFHSWHDLGLKILKENLSAVKRKPPLKVESNPQKVIQRLLTKHKKDLDPVTLELSEELDEFTIASLISLYKANLITPRHLKERSKSDVDELVSKVFQGYEDQLQKINRIDRDDMVSLAAHALVDQVELRTKYQYQYDYVLVDEYQDATAAGDLMARILAGPQDNLYITGDEDEAIYESKGGLPRLMADVSIRMPNARCYILEKNWRCHPAIVDHTRQLIANLSRRRIQKDMTSGWGAAPTTAIIGPQFSESEQAEAEWVADEISILIDSGRNPQDIAVLYRYHRYGIIIEEALSRRSIRCVTSHPEAGLIPDEVGDVMAFLKLVMDPDGPKARESFERVCQLRVKEVDPKLSSTIASFAEANNLSYLKAVEIYSEAVAEQSCLDLSQLVRIIRTMHQENLAPAETISLLKRTQRLSDYYRAVKVPPGVNYEPLRKLAALEEEARKYKTVSEFVKAQTAAPAKGSSASGFESDHVVHILTLHEAKGREFAVSFLVGLAEGLFPADSATDLEEERRLCYVGMTRAKELLYLSFPSIFNNVGLQPSSFLVEARLMAQQPMHIPAPTLPPAAPQVVAPPPQSTAPVAKVQPQPQPIKPAQVAPAQSQPVPQQLPQPVQQPPQPVPQQRPQPVQQPPQPVQQQRPQPVQQPAQPVQQQRPQPVQQPQQPVPQQRPQPIPQQPQPVQQQTQPLQQQPQPVQQPQPAQQPPQPVQQQPQPVQQQPQPVHKPIQQVPQPVQEQPQPVQKQPEPVQEEPPPTQQQVLASVVLEEAVVQTEPAKPSTASEPSKTAAKTSLSDSAAGFHKAFQDQLLEQHATQQKEIASALVASETAEAKNAPLRPGRKGKAEAAQDVAQGLGPVQAALQRRNKNKQQSSSEPVSDEVDATPPAQPQDMQPTVKPWDVIPAPAEQAQTIARDSQTNQPQQAVSSQDLSVNESVIIKADLSIAHDGIVSDQIPRFTGAPPLGRKRGAQQSEKVQPAQAKPQPSPEPALAEAFQPTPQSAESEQYSSLSSDVPPGVVVHSGPVSKGKRKDQPQISPVQEDPNQPPTSYPIPDATETVASYDYTLPPDAILSPQRPLHPEPQGYVPPAIDEQQKMYQMFEPPPAKTTEELLAEALTRAEDSALSHQQHAAQPSQDQVQRLVKQDKPIAHDAYSEPHHAPLDAPAVQNYAVPESNYVHPGTGAEPHALVQAAYDTETDVTTDYADPSQPGYYAGSAQQEPEQYDTGYPSPAVEEYNYTAPHDPAQWDEAPAEDFEHRPRCAGCGTYLEVGSQFCGECGHRLEARIPGCHLCGSPLEPSAKFCGECGSKRVESRPTPPMPDRILDGHMIPDRQSVEYEQYASPTGEKPTQRSWVVKLLKMLES